MQNSFYKAAILLVNNLKNFLQLHKQCDFFDDPKFQGYPSSATHEQQYVLTLKCLKYFASSDSSLTHLPVRRAALLGAHLGWT